MNILSKNFIKIVFLVAGIALFVVVVIASRAPSDFPTKRIDISVEKDMTLNEATKEFYENKIISSPFLFKALTILIAGQRGIHAGDYRFTEPEGVLEVAYRVSMGDQRIPKVKITIPEGTNVYDMAFIYLKSLSDFNAPRFVSLALRHEGYLFPDTYYFLANAKPEEIIREMRKNFDNQIKALDYEIKTFGKPLDEVIIMASLVEEETRADESRRIVSGILWSRLDKGIKLQVDAPFYYITGKAGNFTLNDLKIDSPYNTYLYKGLPKGPISNPGLNAIKDTVMPTKSTYLYYLTGNDGEMRYANTFEGHLANKNLYLK